ncbi:MAG: hypothetical protein KKF67_01760 [Nanoarchaeota archaeon]|nr:hypothetical protein [Nanoarchaeota archaeon]
MKHGQVKIQQMAFMLIAVTLFLALVLIFILVIKFSGLKEGARELEEKNAMLLVSRLANSPEFSCEESFGKNKINCIDADKLMMLKENSGKYEDFWGVSNIEVRKIFPKIESEKICTLNSYPDCNIIRLLSNNVEGFDASNFVILCRKETYEGEPYDKCEIAKIMVSYN